MSNGKDAKTQRKPAVIVGVGGVGKNILLRIRKKIVEEYRSLDALPWVQFLHLDTFTSIKPEGVNDLPRSQNGEIRVLGEDIALSDSERVILSEASELEDADSIKSNKKVMNWFFKELPITDVNITTGTGAVRAYGRLAFHYHVNDFRQAIKAAADRATAGWNGDDTGLDVYIVCSFFGGTGSGCFYEVAYNAKKALVGTPNLNLLGFFVVGVSGMLDNVKTMRANCYAALRELEHYSTVSLDDELELFNVDYPIAGIDGITSNSAPVDGCYLFDAINANKKVFDRNSLEEAVARRVFFEFIPGIAVEFRRKSPDIEAATGGSFELDFVLKRTQRFFGTGLSTVEYPAVRVKNALTYELAADICRHILYRDASGFDDQEVDRFIRDNALQKESIKRTLEANTKTKMRGDLDDSRRKIKGKIDVDDADGFDGTDLSNSIVESISNAKSEVRESPPGDYVNDIESNKEDKIKRLKGEINNDVSESVCDKFRGPKETKKFLDSVIKELSILYNDAESSRVGREKKAKEAEAAIQYRESPFKDDVSEGGYKYRWELKQHNKWLHKQELYDYMNLSVDKVAYRAARDLYNELIARLKDQKEKIDEYDKKLNNLADEFEEYRDEILKNLIKTDDSVVGIPKESLDEMTKYLANQRKDYISGALEDVAAAIIANVCTNLGANNQFEAVLEGLPFKKKLLSECESQFDAVENTNVANFITDELVAKKANEGRVLLRTKELDKGTSHMVTQHRIKWVALPDGANVNLAGYTSVKSGQPYRAIFAEEMGIFPLRCVKLAEDAKEAYDKLDPEKKEEESRVRRETDRRIKFRDIVPPDERIPDIKEKARRLFHLGDALKFMDYGNDPNTGFPSIFLTYEEDGQRKHTKICEERNPKKSLWDKVIDTLAEQQIEKDVNNTVSDKTILEKLEELINEKAKAANTRQEKEKLWSETQSYLDDYLDKLIDEREKSGEIERRVLKIVNDEGMDEDKAYKKAKEEAEKEAERNTTYQYLLEWFGEFRQEHGLFPPADASS